MKLLSLPPQEYLRRIFNYDLKTGFLCWRQRSDRLANWNVLYADKIAGALGRSGYVHVSVDGKLYQAQRLIWKWVNGEDPAGEIDHCDGQRSRNVWLNLRDVTVQQNRMNMRSRGAWPKGVYRNSRDGTFRAQIKKNGKGHYLGIFAAPEPAHAAYRRAAEEMFGEFACCDR